MSPGGLKEGRYHKRRRRIRSGDVLLAVLIVALLLLFIRFEVTEILALLYNPVAGLVIFIMIVEFLWLKSTDRTRIYRLEIDRLRNRRRQDEDLLRRAREVVGQAIDYPETEKEGRPGDWRQRAVDLRKDIEERL